MAIIYRSNGTIEEVNPKNGIDFSLEELMTFVSGHFQVVMLNWDSYMVLNTNGITLNLSYNELATEIFKKSYPNSGFVVGDVLVCKITEI